MYFKCNHCTDFFSNSAESFIGNPFTKSILCPHCKSDNVQLAMKKTFTIVIFDDLTDFYEIRKKGKLTPLDYGVEFSYPSVFKIHKNDMGYEMLFHISNFISLDMHKFAWHIGEFVFNSSSHDEEFILDIVISMVRYPEIIEHSLSFGYNITSLLTNIRCGWDKWIIPPYELIEEYKKYRD